MTSQRTPITEERRTVFQVGNHMSVFQRQLIWPKSPGFGYLGYIKTPLGVFMRPALRSYDCIKDS